MKQSARCSHFGSLFARHDKIPAVWAALDADVALDAHVPPPEGDGQPSDAVEEGDQSDAARDLLQPVDYRRKDVGDCIHLADYKDIS